MANKNIAFLINAQQVYASDSSSGFDDNLTDFFQTVSGTYIPLLNMFESLENDGIVYKISMVFSPVLCTLLADPVVQERYIEWLDRKINFGTSEVERCADNPELLQAANFFLKKARKDKSDFSDKYEQNLIKYFSLYASKGYLELLATTGTSIFLPYYIDLPEAVNAQIETGLYAHRHFFGQSPDGFWLPYLGYKTGLEKSLRMYGVRYTILDSQSILFSETEPENGLFTPVRTYNSLALFGRDSENQITEEDSFVKNEVYCDVSRDVGFEYSAEQLSDFAIPGSARQATGFCYWNNSKKSVYKHSDTSVQVEADAERFLAKKDARLDEASKILSVKEVSLVCTYNAAEIGTKWVEGVDWLEAVIRKASEKNIKISSCADLLQTDEKFQKIVPYPSAAYGAGYGENLLDYSNSWMMRYVRKATERMIDLADRFPADTGLKARLLNLGAKELLLAQSGELAKMIQEGSNSDVAETFFKKCIIAFTTVFDSLGSNTVSTEWLTKLERNHSIFPWMNYRIFSKKR